jgi:hypothetical protein
MTTERIDSAPLRDGDFVGRAEVRVVVGSNEQQRIEQLQERINALLDRIAYLERCLTEAGTS